MPEPTSWLPPSVRESFRTTDLRDLFFGTQQVLDIQESARFAEQFALSLLLAQMAVMVLITPAYAAGAVAEEKERKTFANLLTTELSNREIVLGKFLGRVVFLLGVMLAGLPVLALTGLVGGIDPLFLVLSYALTATTVVLIAAAAVAAAVYAGTFRGAMFRAYGLTALYVLFGCGIYPLLSPFAVLVMFYAARADMGGTQFVLGGLYVAAQLGIAAGALGLAVRRVRPVRPLRPLRPLRPPRDDLPRRKPADESEILVPDSGPTGEPCLLQDAFHRSRRQVVLSRSGNRDYPRLHRMPVMMMTAPRSREPPAVALE